MPFTPDSLLPTAEEEVRRALWCSPEAAGADPCMGLSEKASASDPGEVPTAVTALFLISLAHLQERWLPSAQTACGRKRTKQALSLSDPMRAA